MYIVSACLLGITCKYNGENNYCEAVETLVKGHHYAAVCPEVSAGMAPPRPPSEIRENRVYSKEGTDLTELFLEGAEAAWQESLQEAEQLGEEIDLAILKARSPSCGAGVIYDGTFNSVRVKGDGFFARLLKEKGIKTITEEDC
jgi:uncharacterized protein YbbK (DUF523 family)